MLYNSVDGAYPVDPNQSCSFGIKPLLVTKNDPPSTKKLSSAHLSKITTKTMGAKKTNKIDDNAGDDIAVLMNTAQHVQSPVVASTVVASTVPTPQNGSTKLSKSTVGSIINSTLNGSIVRTPPEPAVKSTAITTTQNNSLSNTTTDKVVPGQSLTPTTHSSSGDEQFAELTYTAVQINLRILGDLKEGEKIMITDDKIYMQVDDRYMQSMRRHITADSRIRTLKFIAHVIDSAKNYCNDAVRKINCNDQKQINLQMLINIQSLLGNALTGLSRLATTYGNDKLNLAMIDTYKSTISVFCDQDLKRAISSDYNSD